MAHGRPRTRTVSPADHVVIGVRVRASERDQLVSALGPGGVSRMLRRAVKGELALIDADMGRDG